MARTSNTEQESYIAGLAKAYDFADAKKARSHSDELNKTMISLSVAEAQIVATLLAGRGYKKFVEVGTLTGHSGLFILKGLAKGGTLWTFEKEPTHATRAEGILKDYASQTGKSVQVIVGDAEETLATIENQGPFDGIFIDGNKGSYGKYLQWAEANVRAGGMIIADNIFLRGGVYGDKDTPFSDKQVEVMKEFNSHLFNPKLFETCIIPTSEGLLVAVKN